MEIDKLNLSFEELFFNMTTKEAKNKILEETSNKNDNDYINLLNHGFEIISHNLNDLITKKISPENIRNGIAAEYKMLSKELLCVQIGDSNTRADIVNKKIEKTITFFYNSYKNYYETH